MRLPVDRSQLEFTSHISGVGAKVVVVVWTDPGLCQPSSISLLKEPFRGSVGEVAVLGSLETSCENPRCLEYTS